MPDRPLEANQIRLVLDHLGDALDPSILIGGWATHVRVGGDISYDIDLIIASPEVRGKVQSTVDDLSASSHLSGTKWRGEVEGVHVDVYLPHESQLGSKLRLRTEVLAEHTDQLGHGKWRLLTIEAHTITKFAALLDRADTEKGAKDAREIASLLDTGVCATEACAILAEATAGPTEDLRGHVAQVFELLRIHAGMNRSQRRILLRRSREWDVAIAAVTTPVERSRPALG